MANQILAKGTANNSAKAVEFQHPTTGAWYAGVRNSTTGKYEAVLPSVPGGTYAAGTLKCRLVGTTQVYSYAAAALTVLDAAAGGAATLSRQAAGLLEEETYATLTPYATGGGYSISNKPGFTSPGRFAIPAQSPGPPGSDTYGGIRESQLYREVIGGVETWFMFWGGGNGDSSDAGKNGNGEWRPQYAISTDMGLSWVQKGLNSVIGLAPAGADEPIFGRDMLTVDKFNGVYLLHAMKGTSSSFATSRGWVPNSPYLVDAWLCQDTGKGPVGPWTFLNNPIRRGVSGSLDAFCAYTGRILPYNGKFYLYYNASETPSKLNIGVAVADSPQGPWVKTNQRLFSDDINPIVPENPKTFYHPGMDFICQLQNIGDLDLGSTDGNAVAFAKDPLVWSYENAYQVVQKLSPMDGTNKVLGIPSPFVGPEGTTVINARGQVPYVYDTSPISGSFPDLHVGRTTYYSVLEPSAHALLFAPSSTSYQQVFADTFSTPGNLSGYNGWTQTEGSQPATIAGNAVSLGTSPGNNAWLHTGENIQNGRITATLTLGVRTGIGLAFRVQDTSNFYLAEVDVNADGVLVVTFFKRVAGTQTQLGQQVSAIQSQGYTTDTTFAVSLDFSGPAFAISVGNLNASCPADSTFTAGGRIGLRSGEAGTGTRTLSALKAFSFVGEPASVALTDNFSTPGNFSGYNGWSQAVGSQQGTISGNRVSLGTNPGENYWLHAGENVQNGRIMAGVKLSLFTSVGFMFRMQDASNGYFVDVYVGDGNIISCTLTKKVNGVNTQVGDPVGINIGPSDYNLQVGLLYSGSRFTVTVAGRNLELPADTTFTAGGAIGLRNGGGGQGDRFVSNYQLVRLAAAAEATTPLSVLKPRPLADFVAEFVVQLLDAPAGGWTSYDYRMQDASNGYRLKLFAGGKLQLFKVTGGTETALGPQSGSEIVARGMPSRVHLSVIGSQHTAYLNLDAQVSVSDGTYASGTKGGHSSYLNAFEWRNLWHYKNEGVSVSGVTAGQVVTLRGAGGIPLESKTATGSTVNFSQGHYPHEGVSVNGQYATLSGGIWGGDALQWNSGTGSGTSTGTGTGTGTGTAQPATGVVEDSQLVYNAPWETVGGSGMGGPYDGNVHYSDVPGRTASATGYGTRVAWWGTGGTQGANATAFAVVDTATGNTVYSVTLNLTGISGAVQQLAISPVLPAGTYRGTVTIGTGYGNVDALVFS